METVLTVALRAVLGLAAIILLTRVSGLRSFSKMSGFDFAVTVAMGSILAAMVTAPGTGILVFLAAFAALFALQIGLAHLRARSRAVEDVMGNAPLLVMENGRPLTDNLRRSGMTLDDLHGKLREANAFDLSKVHAVIFEPTGDVSVLHGEGEVSPEVLDGVRR